jgi:hypothetical protein
VAVPRTPPLLQSSSRSGPPILATPGAQTDAADAGSPQELHFLFVWRSRRTQPVSWCVSRVFLYSSQFSIILVTLLFFRIHQLGETRIHRGIPATFGRIGHAGIDRHSPSTKRVVRRRNRTMLPFTTLLAQLPPKLVLSPPGSAWRWAKPRFSLSPTTLAGCSGETRQNKRKSK